MNPNDLGIGQTAGMGLPMGDLRIIISGLIRTALGVVGIFMVGQIIWSGFLMMTHGGNVDRKVKAVGSLKNSVLGFVVIVSSASLAKFVIDTVANVAIARL